MLFKFYFDKSSIKINSVVNFPEIVLSISTFSLPFKINLGGSYFSLLNFSILISFTLVPNNLDYIF